MKIPFVKMHGAGNDFVVINALKDPLPENLKVFSRTVCHRRFGVGADQVLLVHQSKQADFRMDIYNADGGQVEMCGNGVRCFFSFLKTQGLIDGNEMTVETRGGVVKPVLIPDHPKTTAHTIWVQVDMGEPKLDAKQIPVQSKGQLIHYKLTLKNTELLLPEDPKTVCMTAVSMGNPHCVIFVDDVDRYPVERVGPAIEADPFFPERVNVEFVEVIDSKHLKQRTWERGSGETFACGTGASAVVVAAVLNGKSDRKVTITLKGGDLDLFWNEMDNRVYKTGPATRVFNGEIESF